jgi:hypothetical protein
MPLGAAKAAFLGAAGSGEADAGGVFECIAKQTTSGGATTSVEFTSIPSSTYDNIEVIVTWVPATSDATAGISWTMEIETNGETGNTYGVAWLHANAASSDASVTSAAHMYATQPFYMGYTQYQNGYWNRQRWSNINASTTHIGHTLSGSCVPGQPLGPSGESFYSYDKYGMDTNSYLNPLTSIKFVSEWSRVIEDGTTFTMMGIKSS